MQCFSNYFLFIHRIFLFICAFILSYTKDVGYREFPEGRPK